MSFLKKYITEPLRYTFSDGVKLFTGILLLVFNDIVSLLLFLMFIKMGFSVLILILLVNLFVHIVVLGYYIAVIKNTLEGLDTLPDWSNLGEIVKDGILYFFALFILVALMSFPAILISMIGSFLTTGVDISYPTLEGDIEYLMYNYYFFNLLSGFLLLTIVLIYDVLAATILWVYVPLATVNFAKKGFFGFFEVVDIFKKISLGYIVMLVIYFTVYFTVALILWIIGVVPVIGTAISTVYSRIFYFVFFTTFFRAVAKYYMEKEGWL